MSSSYIEGEIPVKESILNLDKTLLGGQSFRWTKQDSSEHPEWTGVFRNAFWVLKQSPDTLYYKVYSADRSETSNYFRDLLRMYFRLDINLEYHREKWNEAHAHFLKIEQSLKAVRLLRQETFENIVSFMCSQNNHIKRISYMVEEICSMYGNKICTYNDRNVYTFPSLKTLIDNNKELESKLRGAKFGYRAKFIAQAVFLIGNAGGEKWISMLEKLPYEEARATLVKLPGVGLKIADCICLMSLNHLQAVPVDAHILKVARMTYMPGLPKTKSLSAKQYHEISTHIQKVYGPFAGWAQTVIFCSDLPQFQQS